MTAVRAGSRAHDVALPRPDGADLLTPPEVAAILRVAVGTLRNWRYLDRDRPAGQPRRGPKPTYAGSLPRYRREDVDAYLTA